jgi:hypothetical protein
MHIVRHVTCPHHEGWAPPEEVARLKTALGQILELGERCEECDDIDPTAGRMATHETRHVLTGMPITLCDEHAEEARQAHRKAVSKGCGPQPEVEPFEQDTAVLIALSVLRHGAGP